LPPGAAACCRKRSCGRGGEGEGRREGKGEGEGESTHKIGTLSNNIGLPIGSHTVFFLEP
jgi:hypothetical protein